MLTLYARTREEPPLSVECRRPLERDRYADDAKDDCREKTCYRQSSGLCYRLDTIYNTGYTDLMTRLAIDKVPDDLKNAFRIWCLTHRTTMTEQIIAFMRWTVEQDRKGKLSA